MAQFLPLPPVEGDPGRVPAVGAHGDLELYARGHHDGAEGQGVRANRRHHDGGDGGVDHTGARGYGVGSASGWSGDNQTITLEYTQLDLGVFYLNY